MRSLIAEVSHLDGVEIRLMLPESVTAIPRPAALCLYRITQEALRNVVKRSASPVADVELSIDNGTATLRDSGYGSSSRRPAAARPRPHEHGRTRPHAATPLEIRTSPGAGTTLIATIH
jgi:signal transduction histidine kinase